MTTIKTANLIDRAAAERVDADIAAGILAADKRDERIARRRARFSIAVHRIWMYGHIASSGEIVRQPSVGISVYLQYGYQPERQGKFPHLTISYGCEVEQGEPLDEECVAFVVNAVAALRRDFGDGLPTDIKPSVRNLNPDLSIAGSVAAANR